MDDTFLAVVLVAVIVLIGAVAFDSHDEREHETNRIAITNGCSQVLENNRVLWKCD